MVKAIAHNQQLQLVRFLKLAFDAANLDLTALKFAFDAANLDLIDVALILLLPVLLIHSSQWV